MTTSGEVTTNQAAARVQLIPAPIASPGNCVLCGKNEHSKGFADPRLDFEFYGTVYFCGDCVGDFASLFGYINPEQAVLLAKRVQALEEENSLFRESLLNLESAVEHLTDYRLLRNALPDTSNNASEPSATDEGTKEVSGSAGNNVVQLSGRVTEAESDVNESVSEQGPVNISESTSGDSSSPIIPL